MFRKTATIVAAAIIPALLLTGCGEEEKKPAASSEISSTVAATPSVTPAPVFTPMAEAEAKAAYLSILQASMNKMDTEGMIDESETTIVAYDRNFNSTNPNANIAAYFNKADSTYRLIWEGEGLTISYLSMVANGDGGNVTVTQDASDVFTVHNPAFDAMVSTYDASDYKIYVKDGVIVGVSAADGSNKSVITYGNTLADEILTAANATKNG